MSKKEINDRLQKAVIERNLKEVEVCLSAGGDPNLRCRYGYLLHHTSCPQITETLLNWGADIDALNRYGQTPLIPSIFDPCDIEQIRVLLKHGTDVNAIDSKEYVSPLLYALDQDDGNFSVILLLLMYGAIIYTDDFHRMRYTEHTMKLLIKFKSLENPEENWNRMFEILLSNPYTRRDDYVNAIEYPKKCLREILEMKMEKVSNNLSLLEYIQNIFYENNFKLAKKLADRDYSKRYPIYEDVIVERIKIIFMQRKLLLSKLTNVEIQAKSSISESNNKRRIICLDYDCILLVVDFLSNMDLISFIRASTFSNGVAFDSRKHPRLI